MAHYVYSGNKIKKILMSLLLMFPSITMAQQVVVVNISVLSEEGSTEREGVVLQKDAENEAFYNLMVELSNHSDKVEATKLQSNRKKGKSDADILNETIAKMEELKKMGLISDADIQRLKAEMGVQMKKDAEIQAKIAEMAAGPGSSNPSALKERIRNYCVGNHFYWSAKQGKQGLVLVSEKKADGKVYYGFLDAFTGSVLIEPDRYESFSKHRGTGNYFTKDGYAIAGIGKKSVMIDKTGRIILDNGYNRLGFYNDCRILRAANAEWKVGIIDYHGNVLEPFVHNSFDSESLAKAANRIFNEKGGEKVEIW